MLGPSGQLKNSALGHGRRFGATRACFSTASVNRPSARATAGRFAAMPQGNIGASHPAPFLIDPAIYVRRDNSREHLVNIC